MSPLILPPTISERRADHILQGDGDGNGGHSHRSEQHGKSKFPEGWSDQLILDVVADVANDPASASRPTRGGRTIREGKRKGIDVRVIVDADGLVITGYPVWRR